MKLANQLKQAVSRGYKGVLPASIVMRFLDYDHIKKRVTYKKRTEFISTSLKGKKRKHFFEKHLDKGYYVLVDTKVQIQHNHKWEVYELTEAGEDLFTILDL